MLMLLILSLNFNSLWQGLMFIPIILIGPFCAMLGHGIEHQPFSLLSVWGVIALMGVLVNDAVVFLDKYFLVLLYLFLLLLDLFLLFLLDSCKLIHRISIIHITLINSTRYQMIEQGLQKRH